MCLSDSECVTDILAAFNYGVFDKRLAYNRELHTPY